MKRKIISLALALFLLAILPMPVALAYPSSISQVRNGSAVISVTDGGGQLVDWGTGFFVGPDGENPKFLLTSYGILEAYLQDESLQLCVSFAADSVVNARCVDADAETGIALLELDAATSERAPLRLAKDLSVLKKFIGSSVYGVGYIAKANETAETVQARKKGDSAVSQSTANALSVTDGGVSYIETGIAIANGHSGGPFVDDNGYVLGICDATGFLGTDKFCAINISEAFDLLERNNVPFQYAYDCSITWMSQAGDALLETDAALSSGDAPSYDVCENPVMDADAQYEYVFDGWSLSPNQSSGTPDTELPAVDGELVYYAAFARIPLSGAAPAETESANLAQTEATPAPENDGGGGFPWIVVLGIAVVALAAIVVVAIKRKK